MPIRSDEPLRKVTLNLYESDCQWFEKEYGHGWTERLRQHVHKEVVVRQQMPTTSQYTMRRRTIGDISHE